MDGKTRLDYNALLARVAAETGSTPADDDELVLHSPPRKTVAIFEMRPVDLAIRADCELLYDWNPRRNGFVWGRAAILKFVLNRRGVADWPAWAAAWVKEEG